MTAPDSMHAYYSARAQYMAKRLEDDARPWVQEIIAKLLAHARDRSVLEIACGTGNWTRLVAPCARTITATDYSEGMLEVARARGIPRAQFVSADAYELRGVDEERHEFGFSMWLVSHLELSRWSEFVRSFHAHLKPGATVLLADDIRREDDADPWYSKLATRDTYEIRRLPNGESYEIVKTYFTADQLHALLQPYADNIRIHYERPCWWVTYDVRGD